MYRSRLPHRILAALCLVLLLPQPARAEGILDQLKEKALGFAKGCNYAQYIQTVQQVLEMDWSALKVANFTKSEFENVGIPVMDIVNTFLQAGTQVATKESLNKEKESLVYTLEQACQTAVQAYESARVNKIIENGNLNIGKALSWATAEFKMQDMLSRPGQQFADVAIAAGQVYEGLMDESGFKEDTIFAAVSRTVMNTLKATTALDSAMKKLQVDLANARKDMNQLAYDSIQGTETGFACPSEGGYPDMTKYANLPEPMPPVGEENEQWQYGGEPRRLRPICGPVPKERMQQVQAMIAAQDAQVRALQLDLTKRRISINAMGLAADNQARRRKDYAAKYHFPF